MIKKILFVIPLLTISGCVNGNTSIINVSYSFDYGMKAYKVIDDKGKQYKVAPEDYFEIKVYEYKTVNNVVVENEYYVVSEKLFVYVKQ